MTNPTPDSSHLRAIAQAMIRDNTGWLNINPRDVLALLDERDRLRGALQFIQEMAAEDLRTDRVAPRSAQWQIEAEARAALALAAAPDEGSDAQ